MQLLWVISRKKGVEKAETPSCGINHPSGSYASSAAGQESLRGTDCKIKERKTAPAIGICSTTPETHSLQKQSQEEK